MNAVGRRRRLAAMLLCACAGPVTGAPEAAEQTTTLAAAITEKLAGTEQWAVASGFPRNYAIAEMAKGVLVTVDAARLSGRIERAALDRVLAGNVSSQARSALEIVRRECADD